MRNRAVQSAIILVASSALGFLPGCDRHEVPNPAPLNSAPAASNTTPIGGQVVSQIGFGQLSGHTYTHDHFKLSITIPEEWYIQKKIETDQLTQVGAGMIQDPAVRAAAEAAKQRTLTLLSAFRHPPGTPVDFNPNFMVIAENVSLLPGLKQGSDYLKILEPTLRSGMSVKFDIDPIESGFQIGSYPADRLKARMHVVGKIVNQEYYATRVGDYVLLVTISYGDDEEQHETLQGILDGLKAG